MELTNVINARTSRTSAFYDIFINGEKDNEWPRSQGCVTRRGLVWRSYMPRKFKIGATIPQDNCVDICTTSVLLRCWKMDL